MVGDIIISPICLTVKKLPFGIKTLLIYIEGLKLIKIDILPHMCWEAPVSHIHLLDIE